MVEGGVELESDEVPSLSKLPDSLAEQISLLAATEQKDRTLFVTEILWLDVKCPHFCWERWSVADPPEFAQGSYGERGEDPVGAGREVRRSG